ncbi:NUDIX hydrolase [Bacillus sp. JJ1609]|uniref:NUDIX hydrolase n=1 Tax=Bacillus sp. JJ1609 TaxID=3122977 RepID=UPI002FFF1025
MDATFYLEGAVFNYRVAAVIVKNGHVLIHKQGTDSYWALPGGRVEVMEDSQTSIIREVKEELGLNVNVERLLWFTENFFDYNNKNYHEIGLYYQVAIVDGSFTFKTEPFYGEEGERLIYQWVPVEELEEILLYPEFLKSALLEIPFTPQHLIVRK